MSVINKGIIYTDKNCIGCNKCMLQCPIMGANISPKISGHNLVEVDTKKCITCGHCIKCCPHGARKYDDDTEAFFSDLSNGEKISLAVSPSFYIHYGERAYNILGYLRSKGVVNIYDVGFGADISAWCHIHYFEDNPNSGAYISQTCPAVTNYIERCQPDAINMLVPIQSPVICLGIYVHKYLNDSSKIAFLSPCVAKKDEIESSNTYRHISYNVTFDHMMKHISDVDFKTYFSESDLKPLFFGNTFPVTGGFRKYLEAILPYDRVILSMDGTHIIKSNELKLDKIFTNGKADFIDFLSCTEGCINGPGVERDRLDFAKSKIYNSIVNAQKNSGFTDKMAPQKKRRLLEKAFKKINYNDFYRDFNEKYYQKFSIPEDTYEEIFTAMHKDTDESRHIDCNYCGYNTCYNMATAIAYGYNRKEACLHYTKREMNELNYKDTLTGLSNEATFIVDTTQLLIQNPNTEYAVCVTNIENFKIITDLYGYDAENKILKRFADMVSDFVLNKGTCARLNTDFFVMCFPYTDENMILLQNLTKFEYDDSDMNKVITVICGLYITADAYSDVSKAINYASIAVGRISEENYDPIIIYNSEMHEKIVAESDITAQMHSALENNEFTVYFQPQYNHATGYLVGAEALCRWIKPDGTVIPPCSFIPLFEKNGFVRKLDRYIWESSFSLVKKWTDNGINPVPVSVNISRVSLIDGHITDAFVDLLEKYDISPKLIHLEITESAYMSNQNQVVKTVSSLQALGFDIAMDDFGSGYSSLNTLKDVPVDILKLDMGFLRGNADSQKGGNILSSVTHMAQNLSLSIVAEGVETLDQANYMKSIGCDIIQGYLYAKPMPVCEYEMLLVNSNKQYVVEKPQIMGDIDINHFFDPSFPESKMFDHYVGASAIFEYENGKMSIIRINDKYLQAVEMDKREFEVIRSSFLNNLSATSRRIFTEAVESAIKNKTEAVCVTKRRQLDREEPVWIKSHLWCISSSGDRHTIYGIAENISHEKNSEIMFSQSNEKLNAILNNSPSGICLFKISGGNELDMFVPLSVNRHFCKSVSYSEQELLNFSYKDYEKFVYVDDRKKFLDGIIKSMTPPYTSSFVYRASIRNSEMYSWEKLDIISIPERDGTYLAYTNFTNYSMEKKFEQKYQSQQAYRKIMFKESMVSFHLNLTKNICSDGQTEKYPYMLNLQKSGTVDGFFEEVSKNNPDNDSKQRYMKMLNRQNLIDSFNNGITHHEIDHRYRTSENSYEWITTIVDDMLNPNTMDIEAYIYAVNINNKKINEMIVSFIVDNEYDYIIFADILSKHYMFYKNKSISANIPEIDENIDFSYSFDKYIDAFVKDEDKDVIKKKASLKTALDGIEKNGFYSCFYKAMQTDGTVSQKLLKFAYLDREAGQLIITQKAISDNLDLLK